MYFKVGDVCGVFPGKEMQCEIILCFLRKFYANALCYYGVNFFYDLT